MAERKSKGKNALWLLLLLGGAGALVAASAGKKTTTPSVTHKECSGGFCLDVEGVGPDLCTLDDDCVVPPATHKECQNGKCVIVLGEGIDNCTLDGDCVPPPVNPCSVLSMKVTNNPPTPMGANTNVMVEVTNTSTTTFSMNLTMFDFGTNGTGAANFDPITTEKLISVPPGKSSHITTPMTRVDVNPSQLSVVLYKTTDNKACVGTLVDFVNDPAATPLSCSLQLVSNQNLTIAVDVSVSGGTSPYEVLIFWGDGEVSQEKEGGQYTHTYPNPGNAEILLQVTDTEESKCDKSLEVQI